MSPLLALVNGEMDPERTDFTEGTQTYRPGVQKSRREPGLGDQKVLHFQGHSGGVGFTLDSSLGLKQSPVGPELPVTGIYRHMLCLLPSPQERAWEVGKKRDKGRGEEGRDGEASGRSWNRQP